MPKYYVVGATHIDLAWKKGRDEMAEMQEVFVIRLLDALEHYPDFTYVLEQAAHFRLLATRRPDLVERLKPYLQQGRLEFVGGMASTLETNVPCGESFVRNQMLGQQWLRQHLGVEAKTGWLIDTFGINAQVPQILTQFGIRHLLANRFGNVLNRDVFLARGLDGSEVLVAGRDVYSPYVRQGHVFHKFTGSWAVTDQLFTTAEDAPGEGPCLVTPYLENEYYLSLHYLDLIRKGNQKQPGAWQTALPCQFFAALERTGKSWPVVHADLNPEFTGTFSQRITIRQRNRQAENALLEAEKWSTLLCSDNDRTGFEEAWWTMAFNQFHDVFTGSHPTSVYEHVLNNYDQVDQCADQQLNRAVQNLTDGPSLSKPLRFLVLNGLPWDRTDRVTIALPENLLGIERVSGPQGEIPFEIIPGGINILASVPAGGIQSYTMQPGPATTASPSVVEAAAIENEFIHLACDQQVGLHRLVWKETGQVLLENAVDFLVAQQDRGSFQIEDPAGAEVAAGAGELQVFAYPPSPLGQRVILTGAFPFLPWAGPDNHLTWRLECLLVKGRPALDLTLAIDWKGEASRIRLKLPTTLERTQAYYEIPFGVVSRKPYGIRGTARGEWPAQRFVALQDDRYGLALINTGVPGVEVANGTLLTTLLRAPASEYAGMVPDDTSSQHGRHSFQFRLVPYQGQWSAAPVLRMAQELNQPLHSIQIAELKAGVQDGTSWFHLEPAGVVLSAIKAPQDGSQELIVRVYEATGQAGSARLFVRDAARAWHSDLLEQKLEAIDCQGGQMKFSLKPFEIKTLRVQRARS